MLNLPECVRISSLRCDLAAEMTTGGVAATHQALTSQTRLVNTELPWELPLSPWVRMITSLLRGPQALTQQHGSHTHRIRAGERMDVKAAG